MSKNKGTPKKAEEKKKEPVINFPKVNLNPGQFPDQVANKQKQEPLATPNRLQIFKDELQRLFAAKGELITVLENTEANLRQINARIAQIQKELQGK